MVEISDGHTGLTALCRMSKSFFAVLVPSAVCAEAKTIGNTSPSARAPTTSQAGQLQRQWSYGPRYML